MKISKHIHSCLVVEEEGKVILTDPGNYSYESSALDINNLKHLDAIAITHEHPDHMYIPWIKEIRHKFPQVPIFTNSSAKNLLQKEGIQNISSEGNQFIVMSPIPHEKIWMGNPVENAMITLFGKFATPGDSFAVNKSPEILCIPVQGPWGSMMQAVELAIKIKPKVIIPIHDFHLKDDIRKQYYQRLKDYFSQNDIDFKGVETGEIVNA